LNLVFTINGTPITFDFDTILIWCLVGLVAGFFASHLALGHGLGVVGDIVVGILGALLGGFLAQVFRISVALVGHPIISEMIIAFIGAAILLFVVRMFGGRRYRRRALG
jgi:uncharacterized membrane protein YeaQ/YmgE (transglycosylase-associated protein family)